MHPCEGPTPPHSVWLRHALCSSRNTSSTCSQRPRASGPDRRGQRVGGAKQRDGSRGASVVGHRAAVADRAVGEREGERAGRTHHSITSYATRPATTDGSPSTARGLGGVVRQDDNAAVRRFVCSSKGPFTTTHPAPQLGAVGEVARLERVELLVRHPRASAGRRGHDRVDVRTGRERRDRVTWCPNDNSGRCHILIPVVL